MLNRGRFQVKKRLLVETISAMRENMRSYGCFWRHALGSRQIVNLNYLLAYAECGVAFWRNAAKYSRNHDCLRLLRQQSLEQVFYCMDENACFIFRDTKEGSAYWHQRYEVMNSLLSQIGGNERQSSFLSETHLDVTLV